jgi:hypothetical protein
MPRPRRFDDALMRPPDAAAGSDPTVSRSVRPWCEAGAFTDPLLPLAAASIPATAALDGIACELDGTHTLAALPRWRGLVWRVQLQLRERMPGHRPRTSDPWDCGWWRAEGLATAIAFRPRRPTLLLVHEADAGAADRLLEALRAQCSDYRRPLRVLFATAVSLRDLPRLRTDELGTNGSGSSTNVR